MWGLALLPVHVEQRSVRSRVVPVPALRLKYLLIDSAATSEHNVSARFGHARPPSARNLKFIPAFYLGHPAPVPRFQIGSTIRFQ